MKKLLLLSLLLSLCLLAEKPKKQHKKVEDTCHLKKHACRCLIRTQTVQDEKTQECFEKFPTDRKARLDCFAHIPGHCDIVDSPAYGHFQVENPETHEQMSVKCQMYCHKGGCGCDDGPVCELTVESYDESDESQQ